MSTRAQRRKEKHKKKRQEKKEQLRKRQENQPRASGLSTADFPMASNARHRQRLLEQVPKAWPSEMPEDMAVYDETALAALPPDLAEEVAAVREALQWACDSRGEEAIKRTAAIPRSSPLSEWRLFVRGLVSWLEGDISMAGEAFGRLNPDRRPARIATAMMNSLRTDLDQIHVHEASGPAQDANPTEWSLRLDEALLYHAKLLRRVRFDRAAIKIAETGLRVPDETKELLIGPRKVLWLQRFLGEFKKTEPDLAAALRLVALRRAFAQDFVDVFKEVANNLEGPRHDTRNRLLSYFYFMRFANSQKREREAERYLEQYLRDDLPKNPALSEPLRAAIASQIHVEEAGLLIKPKRGGGVFGFLWNEPEDSKAIRKHLKSAIEAYPENREAHKVYAEWVESKLDNDRLNQKQREPHLQELAQVMMGWSKGVPEETKPRLWLVDYLLENERTEEAKPHVDWLATARQDDPRVRATPWKWQLLEAMRLCRRKAWLAEVPARLEEAGRLWPGWLSKDWLPYLNAAALLRAGNKAAYAAQRERIGQESNVKRDSLPDACMMLAAAQHLRVPAADLKPLRAPVDQAVKNLRQVSDEDLLRVSGFFWDLHRTQLQYPAYRMHGGKIVNELFAVLKENPQRVLKNLEDPKIQTAVLLCSEHRCFQDNYTLKWPSWIENPAVKQHPMFTAARVNAFLKLRYTWGGQNYKEFVPLLREAARSERDAYYRHWFAALADELDDALTKTSSNPFGFGFNPFGGMFGEEDEDDDDDEDDDLPFDPNCNCPTCQAARQAYEASR